MTNTIYAVERRRPNGDKYWVDRATGQEVASPEHHSTLSEAQQTGNRKTVQLTEPSKRPLTAAQEKVKETAKLLNLSEAEAEIFARASKE